MGARNRVVEANLGLAVRAVNDELGGAAAADRDDMDQEAMAELVRCVGRFDPARGNAFSTYAYTCARLAVRRARRPAAPVSIPRNAHADAARLADGRGEGMDARRAARAREALVATSAGVFRAGTAMYRIAARSGNPEAPAERAELEGRLAAALAGLPERARAAVIRRFGLDGRRPGNDRVLAGMLGVRDDRVAGVMQGILGRLAEAIDGRLSA